MKTIGHTPCAPTETKIIVGADGVRPNKTIGHAPCAPTMMDESKKQLAQYDPDIHHRRSIRFAGFDYSRSGEYFLTLVTHNRRCLFGDIIRGRMELNPIGRMIQLEWVKSSTIRHEIEIDEFVIMPNHIHGIIRITVGADGIRPNQIKGHTPCTPTETKIVVGSDTVRRNRIIGHMPCAPTNNKIPCGGERGSSHEINIPQRQPRTLGSFVAGFKSAATRAIHQHFHFHGKTIWQRNYYEHIIRNWRDLNRVRDYIRSNPKCWDDDEENPKNTQNNIIQPGRSNMG